MIDMARKEEERMRAVEEEYLREIEIEMAEKARREDCT